MGNILNSLKRFFSNKNTITIIGVLLGVVVLYVGYNWRVNQAVTPVSVPYAKQEIQSRTLITEDMVGFIQVPQTLVSGSPNLITVAGQVVGKYAAYGTSIPANSLFYTSAVMTQEEMPDSAFAEIPNGYTIFSLSVNLNTTYGNSISPGNYIDLYFKGNDEENKIIFGKMIESIEVLAVKDSQGQHVFETTVESRQPAELLFAVPDDMYLLLMKAGYITGTTVEIVPVPRNASYTSSEGDTIVSSAYIKDFIISRTVILPDSGTNNNNETGE